MPGRYDIPRGSGRGGRRWQLRYQGDITFIGDRVAGITSAGGDRHERSQRQHRCERPARVVANSAATRHAAPDQPIGVPPPPRLRAYAYCRWQRRGRRGLHMPLVRRQGMGRLLPDYRGAEPRGRLLVHHHRSLRTGL